MKTIRTASGVVWLAVALAGCGGTPGGSASSDHFPGKPGLQLYSLRALFSAKGVQAGLDQAKDFGFKTVELGA